MEGTEFGITPDSVPSAFPPGPTGFDAMVLSPYAKGLTADESHDSHSGRSLAFGGFLVDALAVCVGVCVVADGGGWGGCRSGPAAGGEGGRSGRSVPGSGVFVVWWLKWENPPTWWLGGSRP